MGSVVSRGGAFRAVVRMAGVTKTKSFGSKKEANIWITQTEAGITASPRIIRGQTLGFVMEKMRVRELAKPYRSSGAELFTRFHREIGHMDLADCTTAWWKQIVLGWNISPYSRLTNLLRIKGALGTAEALWDVKVNWDALRLAMSQLSKAGAIGKGQPRIRRVKDSEINTIKNWAKAKYTGGFPIADIIEVALSTCMRQAEIFRVTWDDLDTDKGGRPMLKIRDRKDPKKKAGNHQDIPLLGNAFAIIKRQPRKRLADGSLDPRIFPFERSSFCNFFTIVCRSAGVKGLHFHDLRHEGISRLFEQGFTIPEVCKVSGHKNWETLRIYTHLSDSLHDGPIAHRRAA